MITSRPTPTSCWLLTAPGSKRKAGSILRGWTGRAAANTAGAANTRSSVASGTLTIPIVCEECGKTGCGDEKGGGGSAAAARFTPAAPHRGRRVCRGRFLAAHQRHQQQVET